MVFTYITLYNLVNRERCEAISINVNGYYGKKYSIKHIRSNVPKSKYEYNFVVSKYGQIAA